jgi:hypothetical protein
LTDKIQIPSFLHLLQESCQCSTHNRPLLRWAILWHGPLSNNSQMAAHTCNSLNKLSCSHIGGVLHQLHGKDIACTQQEQLTHGSMTKFIWHHVLLETLTSNWSHMIEGSNTKTPRCNWESLNIWRQE